MYDIDISIGQSFINPLFTGDINIAKSNFERTLKGEKFISEILVKSKQQNFVYAEVMHCPLYNERQEVIGLSVELQDITHHKKTEQELKAEKERVFEILRNTDAGTWEWNLITGEITFNDQWLDVIGYTVDEISPVNIEKWKANAHPVDLEKSIETVRKHINGEIPFYECEVRMRHKLGHWVWILHKGKVSKFDADQTPMVVAGTMQNIHQKKLAEKQLSKVHQNYSNFFNTLQDYVFVIDEVGNIIHTNQTVEKVLGYADKELYGTSILSIHPKEKEEEVVNNFMNIKKGLIDYCSIPILNKKGMQVPVEVKITKGIWNDQVAYFAIAKDISEIRLSEEKFSKVFYLNPSACCLMDINTGKFIEANDAFYQLLGYTHENVIGCIETDIGIFTKKQRETIQKKMQESGTIREMEIKINTKKGEPRYILLSAENIILQDKKYCFKVFHDITERKMAEQRYIDLFNFSPQPMLLYDIKTLQFIQVNHAAVENYGYTEEEFSNMSILNLRPPAEARDEALFIEKVSGGKEKTLPNVIHLKKNGDTVEVDVHFTTLLLNNKRVGLIIAIDVTEKNRMENEITKAIIKAQEDERYEMGGELHDNVTQILVALKLCLGMMKSAVNESKMDMFYQCMNYLNVSLFEIRNLSHRLIPVFFEDKTLKDAFVRLMDNMNIEANCSMKLYFEPALETMNIRPEVQINLYRILQEQLKNIIKYSKASTISIELKLKKGKLCMSIEDNGIGFDMTQVKKGIGLFNIKRRAELFSGSIRIESSPGKGCLLEIFIPEQEIIQVSHGLKNAMGVGLHP